MSNPQFLTIKQASSMLGVTALTLRNWDNNGKLKALRHPINNYRVYKLEDIEKLLSVISTNTVARPTLAPRNKKRKLSVKHLEDSEDIRDVAL